MAIPASLRPLREALFPGARVCAQHHPQHVQTRSASRTRLRQLSFALLHLNLFASCEQIFMP